MYVPLNIGLYTYCTLRTSHQLTNGHLYIKRHVPLHRAAGNIALIAHSSQQYLQYELGAAGNVQYVYMWRDSTVHVYIRNCIVCLHTCTCAIKVAACSDHCTGLRSLLFLLLSLAFSCMCKTEGSCIILCQEGPECWCVYLYTGCTWVLTWTNEESQLSAGTKFNKLG